MITTQIRKGDVIKLWTLSEKNYYGKVVEVTNDCLTIFDYKTKRKILVLDNNIDDITINEGTNEDENTTRDS